MPNKTKEASDTAEVYGGKQGFGGAYKTTTGEDCSLVIASVKTMENQPLLDPEQKRRVILVLHALINYVALPSYSLYDAREKMLARKNNEGENQDNDFNIYLGCSALTPDLFSGIAGSLFLFLIVVITIFGGETQDLTSNNSIKSFLIMRYIAQPIATQAIIEVLRLIHESPEVDRRNEKYQ